MSARAPRHNYPHPELEEPRVLTSRHRQVIELLAQGLSTEECAHLLNVSSRTLEIYRSQINKAFGARTPIHLGVLLVRSGQLPSAGRIAVAADLGIEDPA